jgi:hypothetical protein
MADAKNDQLKLTKAVAKRIKKVATGPLLGPIEPMLQAPAGEVPATPAPLGTIQDVRERIRRATTEA